MLIRKTAGFFLAALLLAATAFGVLAGVPLSASAETAPATLTTDNASLFLPETYEQYLALKNPKDIAVSEHYIAIADEGVLYLYDRQENVYIPTELGSERTISKLGFTDDERLFVSDTGAGNFFYEYSFTNHTLDRIMAINCSTFCINGDNLYIATVASGNVNFSRYFVSQLGETSPHYDSLGSVTADSTEGLYLNLTCLGGTLYCAVGASMYYPNSEGRFDNDTSFWLARTPAAATGVRSVCAYGNYFYYASVSGIYRTDKTSDAVRLTAEGENGFSELAIFEGKIYCVQGASVREYAVEGDSAHFTGYEIASASSSVNRLSGAADIVRAGGLLVTADKGNNRISVYDTEAGEYQVLACAGVAHVATDGEVIAAATDKGIVIYEPVWDAASRSFVLSETTTVSRDLVVGVVCVYGAFYFVTSDYHYGKIERGQDGWTSSSAQRGVDKTPKAIAADLFGDIFVAAADGNVYKLDEENFTTNGELGSPATTITGNFTSLRAGFDGALYYLDADGNFCGTNGESITVEGKNFIYTDEDSKKPLSFALGYKDDEVYFCFGEFIVKSNAGALGLPSFGHLSDAEDIVRAGDLLVTADTGNNRITVCDMQKRSFSVIQTDFSPTLVATDGSVIAAASGNKVYVCKNPSKNPNFDEPTTADLGTIKGLACVNGTAYYITEYGYGKVEEEDKGLVSRLEGSLEALAADANGILYVVDTSGHVRYYYEDEFADSNVPSGGDAKKRLHTPISSLQVDHEGNLYYISENALWKNDEKLTDFGNSSFGYGGKSSPVAFALDFESDDVYLLYGNYTVKTKLEALGILPQNHSDILNNQQEILPPDSRRKRS